MDQRADRPAAQRGDQGLAIICCRNIADQDFRPTSQAFLDLAETLVVQIAQQKRPTSL
jgi:hypothetical protein